MTREPNLTLSPAEYLAMEATSKERHEYVGGEVWAMAEGSYEHGQIGGNVLAALKALTRARGCRVTGSDLGIELASGQDWVYPAVSVVCGPREFGAGGRLKNPSLVVEVLSPSTAEYDMSMKFTLYGALPSLTDYLVIAQERPWVGHYRRGPDNTWLFRPYDDLTELLELPNQGGRIALAELYEDVDLIQGPQAPSRLERPD